MTHATSRWWRSAARGPLHACEVAESLSIPEVLVPPYLGITSATGLLTSDLRYDQMRTVFMVEGRLDEARLNRDLDEPAAELRAALRRDGVAETAVEIEMGLDCAMPARDTSPSAPAGRAVRRTCLEEFHRLHEREYGHAFRDPVEIVNARVTARGRRPRVDRVPPPARLAGLDLRDGESVYRRDEGPHALHASSRPRLSRGPASRSPGPRSSFSAIRRCSSRPPGPERPEMQAYSSCPTPDEHDGSPHRRSHHGSRRRCARLGRRRDGPQAGSHVLLVHHPRVGGLRLRDLDHEARQLCESSQSTPLQSGPIPGYVRASTAASPSLGEEWRPGDVVIHNHAYYGASHGPDVAFVIPVFHRGELVAFSATTAHHLDLGALTPGTCGIVDATDAYAEGLQFNAIKIEQEGRRNEWIWRLLRDNIRAAQLVVGDMEAQVAACRIGADRFLELSSGSGSRRCGRRGHLITSERMLRRQIERLPDGSYKAEGRLDGFLDHPDPAYKDLVIRVAITVEGRRPPRRSDWDSPQVDLPINMPFEGTVDIAVLLTVRSILLDTATHEPVPTNSGLSA